MELRQKYEVSKAVMMGWTVLAHAIYCVFLSAALMVFHFETARAVDVSDRVEYLGIPYLDRYPDGPAVYARNVWDLQAYQGRIYVGGGNCGNIGPFPNAGPVPILAWDLKTHAVVCEGEVDEEEINRFDVISDDLFIPGTDPMENWQWGNLYRRQADGQWQKLRNIPKAIHIFSLTGYQNILYAGLKATDTVPWHVDFKGYGGAVAVSKDKGRSWTFLPMGGYGVFEFLQVKGNLYALDLTLGPGLKNWVARQDRENYHAPVYGLDPCGSKFLRRQDLDATVLFPDTPGVTDRACGAARPVSFGGSAVYLGVFGLRPFGLYKADSLDMGDVRTRRIPLPAGTIPRDLLVRDGKLFVLLQGLQRDKGADIRVMASRDLDKWVNVLQFAAPTFARSFEMINHDFYFGLGCEVKGPKNWQQSELHPETGRLLRLRGVYLE